MTDPQWNLGHEPPPMPPNLPPPPVPPAVGRTAQRPQEPQTYPYPTGGPVPFSEVPLPPPPPTPEKRIPWVKVVLIAVATALVGIGAALALTLVLPLGSGGKDTVEDAADSAVANDEVEGVDKPAVLEPESEPEPDPEVALTYADLANSTIELPEACVEWVMGEGASAFQSLAGGEVVGQPYATSQFTLLEAEPMMIDGKAFTVATFQCHVGTSSSMAPWAIYDVDGNLIESQNSGRTEDVQGLPAGVFIDNLQVQGQSFTYELPGILVADDPWCMSCFGSGSATVTRTFDGQRTSLVEIMYHLPTGDTTTPDSSDFASFS